MKTTTTTTPIPDSIQVTEHKETIILVEITIVLVEDAVTIVVATTTEAIEATEATIASADQKVQQKN